MTPKLQKLQAALSGKKAVTAKQLARVLSCSIPTIYRRIEALRAEKVAVNVIIEGAGTRRGPKPARFHVGKNLPGVGQRRGSRVGEKQ